LDHQLNLIREILLKTKFRNYSAVIVVGIITVFLNNIEVFAQSNFPTKFPDRIILNLTEDPSSSMAVTWRTDTTITIGYCQLQPASDTRINSNDSELFKAETISTEYVSEYESIINSNQHSYIFTELKTESKYIYRVGSEGNWSEWFQFQTASNKGSEFSFIYFGDPQANLKSEWSRVIRNAYQESPKSGFMLYAGDLINRAGRDIEWQEWFEAGSFIYATIPQIMTPGNHDYQDLILDPHWNSQFTLPQNGPIGLEGTCYYVDYENLRIISIDSATDYELENETGTAMTEQKIWLDSVLTNNQQKWTILTTHLPFYSPKESRDNKHLRKHFQPIIEKHNVDMVLTGHDHSYARGTVSDNPNIKPSIVYVVSVSGPKLYPAGDKKWMQKSISYKQLYQIISIDGNVLTYKAYSASGELLDEFKLNKNYEE